MSKCQVKKTHKEKTTDRKLKNEQLVVLTKSLKIKEKINISWKVVNKINECGTWMEFLSDRKLEHFKLYQGLFCDNRFCPICSKRKSMKDAVELKMMTEYIQQELNREFIMVTFTAPNVTGENLDKEIVKYNKAFKKLMERKKYKNNTSGYIRKLEVTYNNNKKSKSYGTYHPHFHVLISVDKSYFKGGKYIKREDWLKDWQEVMNDNTITQVDVRRQKTKTKDTIDGGILEITKYIAKDSNYLASEEVFQYFYKGLKGKRQYSYAGDFKDAREKLKNGELEKYRPKDETEWYWKVTYKWAKKRYTEERKVLSEKELKQLKELQKLEE